MKDFYDIYYLATNYDFEGRKLQEAIFETLDNRGRVYEKDTLERVTLLKEDEQLIIRWKSFTQNTIKIDLDFNKVIDVVTEFIGEPFESILYEQELFLQWNKSEGKWS